MKIISGFRNILSSTVVLGLAIVSVGILVKRHAEPSPVPFSEFDVHVVLNVLGGLFVVALMTERAVEVIISVLRDADAQVLSSAINATTANLTAAKLEVPPVQVEINGLEALLAQQQKTLDDYRIDTRETTYCISFTLGVAMALVGVRGLHGLLGSAPVSGWFSLVDILVTGAVIAGGSDGIHQMVTAVLDFFNMLSSTSAKKTADANAS
jgi:hypothetical protein